MKNIFFPLCAIFFTMHNFCVAADAPDQCACNEELVPFVSCQAQLAAFDDEKANFFVGTNNFSPEEIEQILSQIFESLPRSEQPAANAVRRWLDFIISDHDINSDKLAALFENQQEFNTCFILALIYLEDLQYNPQMQPISGGLVQRSTFPLLLVTALRLADKFVHGHFIVPSSQWGALLCLQPNQLENAEWAFFGMYLGQCQNSFFKSSEQIAAKQASLKDLLAQLPPPPLDNDLADIENQPPSAEFSAKRPRELTTPDPRDPTQSLPSSIKRSRQSPLPQRQLFTNQSPSDAT